MLLGGYVKDVLQLTVHLANPVDGRRGQSIQERCSRGHVLAGPSKSQILCTFMVDGSGDDLA
jgi:hypothetical protein